MEEKIELTKKEVDAIAELFTKKTNKWDALQNMVYAICSVILIGLVFWFIVEYRKT
jgi:hypothetical protein